MKTLIIKMFFVLFLFGTFSKAQNWLQNYDGIPIHTGLWMDWSNVPGALDSMSKIVDVVSADIGIVNGQARDPLQQINTLRSYGLKLIPIRTRTSINSTIYNWIQHYTDAKYCIWEAEGTSPVSGDASLEHSSDIMTEYTDGDTTYLKLKLNAAGLSDTNLIWDPYYVQDAVYYASQDSITDVEYTANFRLKLNYINGIPNGNDNPNDSICIIQVTYSTPLGTQGLACTHIVKEDTIIRSELKNYFVDFPIIYKLNTNHCDGSSSNEILQQNTFHSSTRRDTLLPGPRNAKEYVEFRVVWLGKPQYLLSIDKVTVSDIRGRELFGEDSLFHRNKIITQANTSDSLNADTVIVGWLGIDEPVSIDIFKLIKLVNQILDDNSQNKQPLYLPLMGKYDGAFRNRDDIHGAMGLSPWTEMKKRIGNMNVWQDFYLYDYPCNENSTESICQGDWRSINIWRMAELNYKQAYELNPNFGVSLQCGEIHNTQAYERNIGAHELLYNSNLALMYGAKFLSLYTYFAQRDTGDCESGLTCHAIVDIIPGNSLYYTPKFYMLKNILKPRLDGLPGKTLKKLTPTNQILNAESLTWYDFINLMIHYGDASYGSDFDLGFFKDSLNQDYFMLINRWYNSGTLGAPLSFNSSCFGNYNNIQIYNLIDSTKQTVINNGTIYRNIALGDAVFFRVTPVVKSGGNLIANETVLSGTTLTDDMSIESGATLTVNGMYYANADITVKAGGKLKYGNDNSKIIFSNNAKLTLEGNAQVSGLSSTSKLTLQYDTSTSIGVVVNPGASPIISYCNITGSLNGISVENEATINVSNTSISNCSNTGIALFHFGNGDSYSTLSTPNIYKCNISNCGTAISAVNCSEVIIKENTITQCNLGLYFNMVNSAYISSNTIFGWQSATGSPMPGISLSSSGGYLRNNTIRYHNFGVLLAYSSPDLGMNTIENNYKCGVYSSLGSYPNLVQQLANPQCWYPIGGCNVIKNNGTFTQFPPSNPSIQPDGAEIFLNSGDVLLSYGFNEISDDRTGIPTYLAIPLIKGTRSREGSREFFVDHNYWGVVGPSPSRFGTLEADYDPTADYCPLPDAPCSGSELIIQTTDGQIVDTLDSRERESTEISALEENYTTADKLFYSGEIEEAKTYYLTIVQGNYTNAEKLYAYNKLYEIGELLKEESSYFTELQNAYNSMLEIESDTLLLKAFNQRSILCDVSKEEYLTAINKFDNIIQQKPNSEEAVYAEIDIITTALNLDTTNSGLGKIGGGKYLVKGTSDYLTKLNDILQSKFGINSEEGKQIIPKEYSLHQNYPNPFNPSTTIKFDLPNDGLVQLEIFDILGRRITTLVNEYKSAGSYEHQFDASSLASGVYIYKLQAGDFVSSKKMILLK